MEDDEDVCRKPFTYKVAYCPGLKTTERRFSSQE